MSNEPRATSLQEISKWICAAAASETVEPGPSLESNLAAHSASGDFHEERIEASLRRARQKTFVRMAKPLRRIWRNQGAVNDSLIEAVSHLAAQNQELIDQLCDLRGAVRGLQRELRRATPPEKEASSAPASQVSGRDGPCA